MCQRHSPTINALCWVRFLDWRSGWKAGLCRVYQEWSHEFANSCITISIPSSKAIKRKVWSEHFYWWKSIVSWLNDMHFWGNYLHSTVSVCVQKDLSLCDPPCPRWPRGLALPKGAFHSPSERLGQGRVAPLDSERQWDFAEALVRASTFSGALESGRLWVRTCWQTSWHHTKPEIEERGTVKTNNGGKQHADAPTPWLQP